MGQNPTGHVVRIAQLGWAGHEAAESLDDVQCGVGCWWVEIDGHRFDHVVSAVVMVRDDEVATPAVTVRLVGQVEIVYTDKDGEPLPGTHRPQTATTETFHSETKRPVG